MNKMEEAVLSRPDVLFILSIPVNMPERRNARSESDYEAT